MRQTRVLWQIKLAYLVGMVALFFCSTEVYAVTQSSPLAVSVSKDTASWGLAVRLIMFMTLLSLLPALLVTMTAFTRIIIVLAILRQGIGIPNVPANQILIGLALVLTIFVMRPMFDKIQAQVVEPSIAGKIEGKAALLETGEILRTFMEKQTRKDDLALFYRISGAQYQASEVHPLSILMPAFVTSELKTAFEIGFLILLPFLVIDIIVSSILMSMGMMMLSPMVISLPFKILFFVLVDGWSLVITSLIGSFRF